MDGMTGIAGGAPANQQMMYQPAQQPQGVAGGMPMPQQQMPAQQMQAPQQAPMQQAPMQQAPMQQGQPPQGVKPPNLFNDWRKDDNGNYADLTGNDVAAMIRRLGQNPQAGSMLSKLNQQHNSGGNVSTGDFRKDAILGMTHLISALSS